MKILRRMMLLLLAAAVTVSVASALSEADVESFVQAAEQAENMTQTQLMELGMPLNPWCGYFTGWYCFNRSAIGEKLGAIAAEESGWCYAPVRWALQKNAGTFYLCPGKGHDESHRAAYYEAAAKWADSGIEIAETFTPRRGDIVLWGWDSYQPSWDHVGIMVSDTMYIDGNGNADYVKLHEFGNWAASWVVGYFRFRTEAAAALPQNTVLTLQVGNPAMTVNGASTAVDAQGTSPVIRNSRVLLPIRAVMEAMGGTVDWDAECQTVTLQLGNRALILVVDSCSVGSSHGVVTLDAPPVIIGGRTMVPIRAVAEFFGATVAWDNDTQTVTITKS